MKVENMDKRQPTMDAFREIAKRYDAADELAGFRDEFVIDDPNLIYMDGNSLGRLPKRSVERAASVVNDEWGKQLIRSWGVNWYAAPRTIGAKISRLVGAGESEVIMSDSTTNNLFKVVMAALMMHARTAKRSFRMNSISLQISMSSRGVQTYLAEGTRSTCSIPKMGLPSKRTRSPDRSIRIPLWLCFLMLFSKVVSYTMHPG